MAAVVAFDGPAAAAGAAAAAGGAAACTAAAGAGAAGGAALGGVAGSAADSVSPAAAVTRCRVICTHARHMRALPRKSFSKSTHATWHRQHPVNFRNSWLCRNEEACVARATAGGCGARVRRKRKEFE